MTKKEIKMIYELISIINVGICYLLDHYLKISSRISLTSVIIIKKMFFKKIKNLIKNNDLFYSSEMLRYENQLEYKSLTGGILSLALIITVLIGFANMIILTMKREDISSTREVVKHSDPPFMAVEISPQNKFMMGIQVYGVNLSASVRYFDYRFDEIVSVGGQVVSVTAIPLIQCTRQHWAQLPQVVANFEHLRISNWLCPQIGFSLDLQGKYSSPASTEYIFRVKQCINSSTVTCAAPEDIAQLFFDNSNQFYLTYFYINSIINENNKDFISYYLQDSRYVLFGDKIGAQAYVYFTDYTISTDYSIWPFESVQQVTGSFVESFWINRPYQVEHQGIYSGDYAYIRINKSSNSVTYNRQVQKISTVLSFIGGMISAVSAILFIIKAYNSQAFEIEIASALFTDSPQNQQLKKNNFFSYMKFNVHKFFKSIGCSSNNQNFTVLQSCLQEMQKQLDVKYLIQRVIFLEHCLSFLFEDYQLSSIQMKRPTSYSSIKKVRQRCFQSQSIQEEDSSSPENSDRQTPLGSVSEVRNSDIKILPEEKTRTKIKQKVNLQFYMDHVVVDDIPSVISQREIKRKNKVENIYAILNKRKSTLLALQENARKGDRVSSKIYNHLYEDVPQTILRQ